MLKQFVNIVFSVYHDGNCSDCNLMRFGTEYVRDNTAYSCLKDLSWSLFVFTTQCKRIYRTS